MILLDVNVVLAAHRTDHPHHPTARPWFDQTILDHEQFGVPTTVWASFLRLSTNRRIFERPTPLPEAFDFISAVVGQPEHVACEPGARHLDLLQRCCTEAQAPGDLVPDAVLAAIAIENGARLASFDRDFLRFDRLEVVRPTLG